ncbi:MAG: FtsX-like permease family protein [Nitrospinae bacterium]|nr:FtsX-like permease family protein [Nitrospinota bacterium]
MNLFRISLIYIRRKAFSSLLYSFLMAAGVAGITAAMALLGQAEGRLVKDSGGIDLVVGAKGSPAQLVLSAVYQMDMPTGNIPLSLSESVAKSPEVASAIPVSLGDSFESFRIVGTTAEYPNKYGARLASGKLWAAPMEAVIGARVARETGLKTGGSFAGAHGVTAAMETHAEMSYTVVGILEPTGSVLDRLILTSLESVWEVHKSHAAGESEITALLVTYSTPMAALSFPRKINAIGQLQAASPAFETARIMAVLGSGMEVMKGFFYTLIVTAGLGVFLALYSAMKERRRDLAIMRLLGASRAKLFAHIILEGLIITALGIVAGLFLGHTAAAAAGIWLDRTRQLALDLPVLTMNDLYLAAITGATGLLASLIPAFHAYSTDVAETLSETE